MVTNVIIKILILLGLILPIVILTFNNNIKNYKGIILFVFYYLMWCFFNSPLCYVFGDINFINSIWNWEGKILALVFSIIFLIVFNKSLKENNFFTFKQKENSIKYTLLTTLAILLSANLYTYFSPEKTTLNIDSLAFQISMPGTDEEFAFRGIMLGLLMTSLNESMQIGKIKIVNPSVLITAFLFGLIHGFPLTPNLLWQFDYFSFTYSFIFGLIWGWMVLKSRSILMPILSHSMNDFTLTLTTMIK